MKLFNALVFDNTINTLDERKEQILEYIADLEKEEIFISDVYKNRIANETRGVNLEAWIEKMGTYIITAKDNESSRKLSEYRFWNEEREYASNELPKHTMVTDDLTTIKTSDQEPAVETWYLEQQFDTSLMTSKQLIEFIKNAYSFEFENEFMNEIIERFFDELIDLSSSRQEELLKSLQKTHSYDEMLLDIKSDNTNASAMLRSLVEKYQKSGYTV